jgi:hypothetical protein
VGLGLAVTVCAWLFELRDAATWPGRSPAQRPQVPDSRVLGYTADELHDHFGAIGSRGGSLREAGGVRALYVATQLTLDLVFPVAYGALAVAVLVWLFPRPTGWVWVPVAVVVTDLSENLLLVGLASTFNDPVPGAAWRWGAIAASCCTVTKWVLVFALLPIAAVGLPVHLGASGNPDRWLVPTHCPRLWCAFLVRAPLIPTPTERTMG